MEMLTDKALTFVWIHSRVYTHLEGFGEEMPWLSQNRRACPVFAHSPSFKLCVVQMYGTSEIERSPVDKKDNALGCVHPR